MRRTFLALLSSVLLLFVWSDASYAFDWGPATLQLRKLMTEQQAIQAIGHQPNKAEQSTCGTESPQGAWECRILTWGDLSSNLTVYEVQIADAWVVNNWSSYP